MSLRATIEPSIRQILGAPDIEQANVTAKSVRKRLIESGTDQDLIRDNKEEITALIVEIFTEMFPNAAAQAPATVAQEPPKTPLKRKREDILKEEDSVVPPSSPPIKIVDQIKGKSRSKYGDLDDDEKAAKKLDQALNGERSLRGGSKRGDSKKKRSTESNRGKRVKSKATIDDESDDDGSQAAPKRRKANEGGGTGGGFQKELMLRSDSGIHLEVRILISFKPQLRVAGFTRS